MTQDKEAHSTDFTKAYNARHDTTRTDYTTHGFCFDNKDMKNLAFVALFWTEHANTHFSRLAGYQNIFRLIMADDFSGARTATMALKNTLIDDINHNLVELAEGKKEDTGDRF